MDWLYDIFVCCLVRGLKSTLACNKLTKNRKEMKYKIFDFTLFKRGGTFVHFILIFFLNQNWSIVMFFCQKILNKIFDTLNSLVKREKLA